MNFDELAYFLVGAKPTDDQRPEYRLLREWVTNFKKEHYQLKSGEVNPDFITADSPIPFSARKLWYDMNWWLNATFSEATKDKQTKESAELLEDVNGETKTGNFEELKPAEFKPYPMGSSAPYKSKHQDFYSYEKKLLSRLKDSRFDFMFHPGEYKKYRFIKGLT